MTFDPDIDKQTDGDNTSVAFPLSSYLLPHLVFCSGFSLRTWHLNPCLGMSSKYKLSPYCLSLASLSLCSLNLYTSFHPSGWWRFTVWPFQVFPPFPQGCRLGSEKPLPALHVLCLQRRPRSILVPQDLRCHSTGP